MPTEIIAASSLPPRHRPHLLPPLLIRLRASNRIGCTGTSSAKGIARMTRRTTQPFRCSPDLGNRNCGCVPDVAGLYKGARPLLFGRHRSPSQRSPSTMSIPSRSSSSSNTFGASSSRDLSRATSCTTPEPDSDSPKPEAKPAPFVVPQHEDPRDYTFASLAGQYDRMAQALVELNYATSTVLAEFKALASELASRSE